jgi:hypothetical protein
MKGMRINYTVYSPDHASYQAEGKRVTEGECWICPTVRCARKKARYLGIGSLVVRSFNQENWNIGWIGDWWSPDFCWIWNGIVFKKVLSSSEKKWVIDRSHLKQDLIIHRHRSGKP